MTLTAEQRKQLEETLIRALRARYPGRPVTAVWKDDPVRDLQPSAGTHTDGAKDAA